VLFDHTLNPKPVVDFSSYCCRTFQVVETTSTTRLSQVMMVVVEVVLEVVVVVVEVVVKHQI
jgi:hypothetical protein